MDAHRSGSARQHVGASPWRRGRPAAAGVFVALPNRSVAHRSTDRSHKQRHTHAGRDAPCVASLAAHLALQVRTPWRGAGR
jgi:hypothetical protein